MVQDPIEARHEAVLEKLIEVAESDDRVVAAWLQGSRADGSADPFSDIDFYVAISDEAYDSFDRLEFIERAVHVLVHAELPGNFGVVCLVEGPVKLDMLVEKASTVGQMKRPAAKILVDKDDVESKLVTGWSPSRGDVTREVDRLIRMTFQGGIVAGPAVTSRAVDDPHILGDDADSQRYRASSACSSRRADVPPKSHDTGTSAT